MLSIDTERAIIEGAGHELGCWEHNVELLIEEAGEAGVDLEGRHNELYRSVTLMDRVIDGLAADRLECFCQVTGDQAAGWPVAEGE